VLAGLAAIAGISAGCGGAVSNKGTENGDAGMTDATSSSSGDSSSGGEDAGCAQFTDDANLTTPTVSFKNDVYPLFQLNCGQSTSCHGGDPAQVIAAWGLFLGCSNAQIDAGYCTATGDLVQEVYSGLVGASANTSLEETCMPFVTPGKPTKSYLMHKMDGDQGCTVNCCVPNNAEVTNSAVNTVTGSGWCGSFMPYLIQLLPAGPVCGGSTNCSEEQCSAGSCSLGARDTVRAWIAQGAMNN